MLDEFKNVNKPVNNPPLRSYDASIQQDLAYCIIQIKGAIMIKTRLEVLNEKAKNTILIILAHPDDETTIGSMIGKICKEE